MQSEAQDWRVGAIVLMTAGGSMAVGMGVGSLLTIVMLATL